MLSFRFPHVRVLTVGLLLVSSLILDACNSGVGKRLNAAPADNSLQIHTLPVELKQLHRNVESVGSLFAQEEVTVSSEVEGKVDSVLVDVGDRVEAGQPIVKVSTIELNLALEQQRAFISRLVRVWGLPVLPMTLPM